MLDGWRTKSWNEERQNEKGERSIKGILLVCNVGICRLILLFIYVLAMG